ncbi:MAG: hypothetical protein NTY16_00910 [Deltaproteobacteria bacterium]|nr:hypothetical protein [Deltaproteobacteria bacterium]
MKKENEEGLRIYSYSEFLSFTYVKILYNRGDMMQEVVKTLPIEISMGEYDSARMDPFTEGRIWGCLCPKRDGAVF